MLETVIKGISTNEKPVFDNTDQIVKDTSVINLLLWYIYKYNISIKKKEPENNEHSFQPQKTRRGPQRPPTNNRENPGWSSHEKNQNKRIFQRFRQTKKRDRFPGPIRKNPKNIRHKHLRKRAINHPKTLQKRLPPKRPSQILRILRIRWRDLHHQKYR